MGVDVVWSANILISANVSYKDALGIPVTSFPKILKHYMCDTFFFDLASTLPSLVTLYSIPNLYYFKVLRLV